MMARSFQVRLSDHVKVLKVIDSKDSSQDSQLVKNGVKDFNQYWVVLLSNIPGEGSLSLFRSKSDVSHKVAAVSVESLSEINAVRHLSYSKKHQVLQISYPLKSLFLSFASHAVLLSWRKQLENFVDCFPLFLLKCPQYPLKAGRNYVLQLRDTDLFVCSTDSSRLAWRWNIVHIRRYCYEPKIPYLEIEAGRSSETGEGCFFFSGNGCQRLYDLLMSFSRGGEAPKPKLQQHSHSLDFPVASSETIRSSSADAIRNVTGEKKESHLSRFASSHSSIPLPPRSKNLVDHRSHSVPNATTIVRSSQDLPLLEHTPGQPNSIDDDCDYSYADQHLVTLLQQSQLKSVSEHYTSSSDEFEDDEYVNEDDIAALKQTCV